jgi:hypothetical protein
MTDVLRIELTPEQLDALATAIATRINPSTHPDASPWLSGAQAAADYLGWPRERIYNRLHHLPHHRDETRLMFRRDELDSFITNHEGSQG